MKNKLANGKAAGLRMEVGVVLLYDTYMVVFSSLLFYMCFHLYTAAVFHEPGRNGKGGVQEGGGVLAMPTDHAVLL